MAYGNALVTRIFEAIVFPHDARPVHWLAVIGIVFLAITSNATAVGRFVSLVRAITAAHPAAQNPESLRRDKDRAA